MPCSGNSDRALPPGLSKEEKEKGCVRASGKGEFMGERVSWWWCGGAEAREYIALEELKAVYSNGYKALGGGGGAGYSKR